MRIVSVPFRTNHSTLISPVLSLMYKNVFTIIFQCDNFTVILDFFLKKGKPLSEFMRNQMSEINIYIVVIIIVLGLSAYIVYASRKRKNSWKLFNFFLAGQTMPTRLAGQVYWGNSLALGNGIVFFSSLAVFWGPAALWVQVPWCIGMIFLGRIAPLIGRATEKDTLHGFLAKYIGSKARYIASIVTSFGFILNLGFEVMVGATIIVLLTGRADLMWVLLILLSLFFAAYCNIGGYRANAQTDKIQNYLGLMVIIGLTTAAWFILPPQDSSGAMLTDFFGSLFNFNEVPIWPFISMCTYAFFVQFVDMSNWQNISATRLSGSNWDIDIKRDFKWAAISSFFVPGLLCVMLAYPFLGFGTSDEQFLVDILKYLLPIDQWYSGVLWGFVLFTLFGTMQSTADSFLMASSQTLSWDMIEHQEIKKAIEGHSSDQTLEKEVEPENIHEHPEYRITFKSRARMFPVAIAGGCVLYGLSLLSDNIIQLMFLIFGSQLALLPAVIVCLYAQEKKKKLSPFLANCSLLSIVCGFIFSSSTIFFNTMFPGVVDLAAFFALIPSTIICVTGCVFGEFITPSLEEKK